MSEVGDFLMRNYYAKYKGNDPRVFAGREVMEQGLAQHPDKIVVVRDDGIKGVAVFLSLSDETMARLNDLDIEDVDVLMMLLKEHGPNIHFIIVAGSKVRYILTGIRAVKDRLKPKTISWWNPDLSKLHIYKGV